MKLNRPEEALSHLKTAERLGPGWHLMWVEKDWQSIACRELERWAEANAALDESIRLLPSNVMGHIHKEVYCMRLVRDEEARELIGTARRLD